MEFIRRLFRHMLPTRKWHVALRVDAADQIPANIPVFSAVMVGTDTDPRWLAFECPCSTSHQIMLNLDRRRSPSWTVTNTRRLTITPSVDSHRPERRCHYVVCRGKVNWVPANWRHNDG